ncbi:hypothetical protein BJ742DRAFT_788388 [Cladochytrium replicatum]|nr:hypothetical protein BJ742DRAFT_788388 [Cladochytrium replicatum]
MAPSTENLTPQETPASAAETDRRAFQSVPILSYATLKNEPVRFLNELRDALLHVGFFYLVDTPVSNQEFDNIFEATRTFFDLPLKDRLSIDMNNSRHFRGYSRWKEEITAHRHDNRDQVDFGPESEPAIPYPNPLDSPLYLNLYGPNQFPATLAEIGFKETILQWHSKAESLALEITPFIARSLNLSPDALSYLFNSPKGYPPFSRMKIIRYPPANKDVDGLGEAEDHGLGVGPHKDGGFLTVLAQDSVGGLQVQNFDGEWVNAPPLPYSFVINVGQQIELVSDGVYPSTTHRVLTNRSGITRHSVAYFLSPTLDSQMRVEKVDKSGAPSAVKSEVPNKELLMSDVFGVSSFRGLARSHVGVVERWYPDSKTLA